MVRQGRVSWNRILFHAGSQFRRPNSAHIIVGIRETRAMTSLVPKRSTVVAGQKTSISLEDDFWNSLREIAAERGETLSGLINRVNAERGKFANLSSAVRMFVLGYYRDRLDRPEIVTSFDPPKSIEHTARG